MPIDDTRIARPRSGSGPGLLLLPDSAEPVWDAAAALYAEEGYVVLTGDLPDTQSGIAALRARPECTGKIGVLGFGSGGSLACLAAAQGSVDCAVAYDPDDVNFLPEDAFPSTSPLVVHLPDQGSEAARDALAERPATQVFVYPGSHSGFATPGSAAFDKSAALIAHTRSLALLRRVMGPHYDLEALWEQHTALEFAARDAEATMDTMVAEPYVNHVPTMTGGVGYTELLRFYKHHFIPTTPSDARLIPVSRTVGVDRLVDEFVFAFTHDREIDWLLPGIPPTGRHVEIPMLAVVRFRGDKLYNEHIYWDQASVLVQVGLLGPKLLPVAGVETARKLLDETLPSNTLMPRWPESAPR